MSDRPISDHALLSDCHGAALIDRQGSVEWMCLPAFDSPAVFARLLDDDAGHFAVAPVADADVSRAYLTDSLVLRTVFTTVTGKMEVTDALAMAGGVRGHDLGAGSPHVLLRRAVCTHFYPTGAMVAAPTTSLPETVGGERNWDYRYAWVRDASFTLDAQWVAACPDESAKFLRYLATAATSIRRTRQLQIMFGIRGERDLTERELTHLSGWRNSRPVRVGNGAWAQPQLDVYGELLDAVHCLREQLGEFDEPERDFLMALADTAADVWDQTDQGIWEVRGAPRHYLYSKLMCRVALDRAIDLADQLQAGGRAPNWTTTRDRIRDAILTEGEEGTFLLCTFWLAEARARAGQPARARAVFDRAARYANDVGLLSEEVDPGSGELLGNFPQAFSHIGLVNAAWAIAQAEGADPDEPGQ